MSEIFVQESRFEDHLKDCNDKFFLLLEEQKTVDAKLDNRVTYKHFTWILGILIMILIGLFGYIASQIKDVQVLTTQIMGDITDVKSNVSKIQGKLEPYNIEFRE